MEEVGYQEVLSGARDTLEGGSMSAEYERMFREYANTRVATRAENPFCRLLPNNELEWNFHEGQSRVMWSQKRIIAVIAGRQSGKTSIGPIWLWNEMRRRGPGMYMVVAPSFPLLIDSALPKIEELFIKYMKLGNFRGNPLRFILSREGAKRLWRGTPWENSPEIFTTSTVIRFGHAANPESLEAKTALAAWLDEAGQDAFKMTSWEAIEGRLTTTEGRCLITTTPYNLGWLKTKIFDPYLKAANEGKDHPSIDLIKYSSIMNPAFSQDEYYRLQASMPRWRWDMFYNGEFTVPAGLIYSVLREKEDILRVDKMYPPANWPRYAGFDFGGPNACGVKAARDPKTGLIYLYDTYFPGESLNARQHVERFRQESGMRMNFDRVAGGAKSESGWRGEFTDNGLYIEEPSITDLDVGIQRVQSLMFQERIRICEHLKEWWTEAYTYQYETDPETGDTLSKLEIKNKSNYHHMDATRYLCSLFNPGVMEAGIARAGGDRPALTQYGLRVSGVSGIPQTGRAGRPLALTREQRMAAAGRAARAKNLNRNRPMPISMRLKYAAPHVPTGDGETRAITFDFE